ncbi:MAG: monofunctional biosynthetic peptidoglycan transglycosylase [Alphaproteobacteria bacterium]|nr:monofunctional biosynthetic peptidoglycan transglycosylase [Alphaproteobacteria bacterium]
MSSERCVARVEAVLRVVPGVENAIVDLDRAEAVVRLASSVPDVSLAAAVEVAGYTLLLAADREPEAEPAPAAPSPAAEPTATQPTFEPIGEAAERRSWIPPWSTFWFVAGRGVAIFFAGSIFLTLLYRFVPVPITLHMLGTTLIDGHMLRKEWVPLERISPNLVRAVIASEDGEFCNHYGFDFEQMEAAWKSAKRNGERPRGASTISQQTAKNAFLWNGRSYLRKGLEAYFTGLIELVWPKRRIMEVYLNIIEWGPGVFGAEAASRHWFRKSAAKLTPLEAARLAAILPNPNRYRANPPGPYVADRGYTIAARANGVDARCARR